MAIDKNNPAFQPGEETNDEWLIRTNRTTAAQGYPKEHPKNPENKAKAEKVAAAPKK